MDRSFGSINQQLSDEPQEANKKIHPGHFQYLVDMTPAIVFLADINGDVLYFNPATLDFFGYDSSEIMGWNIITDHCFIDPEDVQRVNDIMSGMYRDKIDKVRFEARCRSKDGQLSWISWFLHINWAEDIIYVIGHDITESKTVADELESERNKLLEAQEMAHIGNWAFDMETGKLYWSKELFSICGYDSSDFKPSMDSFADIIHPEDKSMVQQAVQNLYNKESQEFEARIIHKDNRIVWVRGKTRYSDGKFGRPLRIFGTFQDITREKLMAEEIKDNETRFQAVFENASSPLLLCRNGIIVMVNKAFLLAFGCKETDMLIGESELQFFTPESRGRLSDYTNRRGKGIYAPLKYEVTGLRRDGSTFEVEIYVSTFAFKNELFTVASLIDITVHKNAATFLASAREKAEAANMLKSEFLTNMTHELKTPLNAIIGPTELLLSFCKDEESKEYLGMIKESAYHLLKLIDNLLDIAKIDQSKSKVSADLVNIREMLGGIGREYNTIAQQKGLHFHTVIEKDIPDAVICDGAKVYQVIRNLLSNAVAFTDIGDITLRSDCVIMSEGQARIQFEVSDTGIGIPQDDLDWLFGRLDKSRNQYAKTLKGSGFGIEVCRKLVNLMNGTIWAESTPGKGSSFFFEIDCPLVD